MDYRHERRDLKWSTARLVVVVCKATAKKTSARCFVVMRDEANNCVAKRARFGKLHARDAAAKWKKKIVNSDCAALVGQFERCSFLMRKFSTPKLRLSNHVFDDDNGKQ